MSDAGFQGPAALPSRPMRIVLVGAGCGLGQALETRLRADGAELVHLPGAGPGAGPGPALPEGDVVLLDADQPGGDPLHGLPGLARPDGPPVAVVTRRPDEIGEMRSLAAGADAYLDLNEAPWKLCLRLDALRRRGTSAAASGEGQVIRQGPLVLDLDRCEAFWNGRPVRLSATELHLLAQLARRPGHVRTRAQLMDAVLGDRLEMTDRAIDSHIKRLRKKLRSLDPQFSAIRTLYGIGYSFSA